MMRLVDLLFPPRVDELALRGTSRDDFLALVAPRLVSYTQPETVALLPFAAVPVRAAIHEAKYHGSGRALQFLGFALADYIRDADDIRNPIIVPVPLGRGRRRERGFNQIEEIVRRAGEELSIPVDAACLVRTRETVSQVSLPRHAREENMRGAFRAAHPVSPAHTYIVIDDVITTGATLQAAVNALKGAGALHIIPLALAH
ncbi:ComF family protein [Patescibacteria group bacterium]|nr:ComF family protein [Patescibacteria group bacterium]